MILGFQDATDNAGERRGAYLWLVAGLLVATLPNAVYLLVDAHKGFWFGEFITSVFLVALPLLLGFSGHVNLAVLLPFAVFAPGLCEFAWFTHFPPSMGALLLLEEASWSELSVFLPQLMIAAAGAAAVALFYGWLIRRGDVRIFRLGTRSRIVGAALLLACLCEHLRPGVSPTAAAQVLVVRLERMSPVGPAILAVQLQIQGSPDKARSRVFKRYTVRQVPPSAGNEVCILVIGEAVRRSAMGLYNPVIETTPRIGARRDLIIFQNAFTCAPATEGSVPIILTGRMPGDGEMAPMRQLGLVEAFSLAGFHTAWITNQGTDHDHRSFQNAFAVNADERFYPSVGADAAYDAGMGGFYDEVLLDPLSRTIRANDGKLFVIVHLIGSHAPYLRRYPPSFEKWSVSDRAKKTAVLWMAPYGTDQQTQFTHAYLNSLLYTDFVLDQLLQRVSATGRMATVVYLADHGENKPDAPILPASHGTITPDVIEIPFLIWFSPEMRKEKKALVDGLISNTRKHISTLDVFPTLCELYNLRTFEADSRRSLANPHYEEQQLKVVTAGRKPVIVPYEHPKDVPVIEGPQAYSP